MDIKNFVRLLETWRTQQICWRTFVRLVLNLSYPDLSKGWRHVKPRFHNLCRKVRNMQTKMIDQEMRKSGKKRNTWTKWRKNSEISGGYKLLTYVFKISALLFVVLDFLATVKWKYMFSLFIFRFVFLFKRCHLW